MKLRIFSFMLMLALVIGCFAGCGGKKGGGKDTATNPLDSLTDDREKLLYFTDEPIDLDGFTNKFSSLAGISDSNSSWESVLSGSASKVTANIDISKLEVNGSSVLQQMGGAFGVSLEYLGNDSVYNLGLSASASGMNMNLADILLDANALLIKAPLLLGQNIFIEMSAFEGLVNYMTNLVSEDKTASEPLFTGGVFVPADDAVETPDSATPNYGSTDASSILLQLLESGKLESLVEDFISEYCDVYLSEANIAHLKSVLVNAIPAEYVSSDVVGLDDVCGDYIKTTVNADCVTITLNSESVPIIAKNLLAAIKTDATVKQIIVEGVRFLVENADFIPGISSIGTPDSVYDAFVSAIEDLEKEISDGETSEEATEDEGSIIIKRYLVNGVDARLYIEFNDPSSAKGSFEYWDVYSGSANEYGVKFVDEGNVLLDIVGGYAGDDSGFVLDLNNSVFGASVGSDGVYEYTAELYDVADLSIVRKGSNLTVDGAIYDGKSKACEIDIDMTATSFDAVVKLDDGSFEVLNIKGTKTVAGNTVTYNVDATANIDGETITLNFTCSSTEKVSGKTASYEYDITATVPGLLDAAVKVSIELDGTGSESPEAPVADDKCNKIETAEELFNAISSLAENFDF